MTILPAPEGYHVDFANPQRHAVNETFVVAAIGNFLCLLFMTQRIYTKIRIMNLFQIEDCKDSFSHSIKNCSGS